MVEFSVVPERTALINIDLQECFVRDSPIAAPEGPAVLERLNRLAAACRQAGIAVIHTRFVLRPDGSNMGILRETSPPAREGILNEDARSAQLDRGLVTEKEDIILDKSRFGAFFNTDLEEILRRRGIDTLIIGGIATNFCCETTAREAMQRDFRVFFLSDGTATADIGEVSAAELQRASLTTLGFLFAQVLTVDEMLEMIVRA
ncbi:MAG: cysteine hydrolase [Actinobacteria bacterium]|nr:cysteine hydrolase [Actinomycetota bacterium]